MEVSTETEPPEEKSGERVWSISEEQDSQAPDLENPSIEVDLNSQQEPEPQSQQEPPQQVQPVAEGLNLDTDTSPKSDDEDKPSDDDLTPTVQSTMQTAPPEANDDLDAPGAAAEPPQSFSEDSPTDPAQQIPPEPSLDLDIEKARQVDQQQEFQSSQPHEDIMSSDISVDQNTMAQVQAESYGVNTQDFDAPVTKSTYKPQKKSFGSKIGSFFVKILVAVCILVIVGSVGLILAVNLEILSKEKTRELRSFLVATLPINIKDPLSGINITQTHGQWINSSNGPLFVVRGSITNLSDSIVNYIQLKAEYLNNGQVIYNTNLYAGNTFTSKELQTLSLNKITERLNRRNGDIDFSDPRKLAGTNYNLMPGDSIEFYSIFPSKTQILGLKHNIEVIDAEIILVENSV